MYKKNIYFKLIFLTIFLSCNSHSEEIFEQANRLIEIKKQHQETVRKIGLAIEKYSPQDAIKLDIVQPVKMLRHSPEGDYVFFRIDFNAKFDSKFYEGVNEFSSFSNIVNPILSECYMKNIIISYLSVNNYEYPLKTSSFNPNYNYNFINKNKEKINFNNSIGMSFLYFNNTKEGNLYNHKIPNSLYSDPIQLSNIKGPVLVKYRLIYDHTKFTAPENQNLNTICEKIAENSFTNKYINWTSFEVDDKLIESFQKNNSINFANANTIIDRYIKNSYPPKVILKNQPRILKADENNTILEADFILKYDKGILDEVFQVLLKNNAKQIPSANRNFSKNYVCFGEICFVNVLKNVSEKLISHCFKINDKNIPINIGFINQVDDFEPLKLISNNEFSFKFDPMSNICHVDGNSVEFSTYSDFSKNGDREFYKQFKIRTSDLKNIKELIIK